MNEITGDELIAKITTNRNLFEDQSSATNKELEELRSERVKLLSAIARGENSYEDLCSHDDNIAKLERFLTCYPDFIAACDSEAIIAEGLNDAARAGKACRERYFKLKAERSPSSESDFPRRLRHLAKPAGLLDDCDNFLAEEC